jgi:hypothetical protein
VWRLAGETISKASPEKQVSDERVAECRVRQSRVRVVVSSVYVRLRSSAFEIDAAVQVADVNGIQRTIIQISDNWKLDRFNDASEIVTP